MPPAQQTITDPTDILTRVVSKDTARSTFYRAILEPLALDIWSLVSIGHYDSALGRRHERAIESCGGGRQPALLVYEAGTPVFPESSVDIKFHKKDKQLVLALEDAIKAGAAKAIAEAGTGGLIPAATKNLDQIRIVIQVGFADLDRARTVAIDTEDPVIRGKVLNHITKLTASGLEQLLRPSVTPTMKDQAYKGHRKDMFDWATERIPPPPSGGP